MSQIKQADKLFFFKYFLFNYFLHFIARCTITTFICIQIQRFILLELNYAVTCKDYTCLIMLTVFNSTFE